MHCSVNFLNESEVNLNDINLALTVCSRVNLLRIDYRDRKLSPAMYLRNMLLKPFVERFAAQNAIGNHLRRCVTEFL